MVTGSGWVKEGKGWNEFPGTNRRQQALVHVYTEIINRSAKNVVLALLAVPVHHNSSRKMLYFLVNIMLIPLFALAAVNIAAMSH